MLIVPLNLESPAIRLVPLSLSHLDDLCAVGLEPQLWRATTIKVRTRADMEGYVRAALDAQVNGTALPFVIIERASGAVVGTTRFHSMIPDHKRVEIGFTWIALSWQRTFVNTEAKYLMLQHAFDTLGCIRVEFRADAGNEQSCRALLRIGAHQEGILRSYRVSLHRGVRDMALFSIIAPEWPRVRSMIEKKLRRGGGAGKPPDGRAGEIH